MNQSNEDHRLRARSDLPPLGWAQADDAAPEDTRTEPATTLASLEDRLLRTLADAENARKRTEQRIHEARTAERDSICAAWLSIVDNLNRALENSAVDNPDPVIAGVRAVRDEAVALLASLGYARHEQSPAAVVVADGTGEGDGA